MYREIEGDLVQLGKEGNFDAIVQGCNCFCIQGAGLAPQFVKAFKTDKFTMESDLYRGDFNKLGTIDYEEVCLVDGKMVDPYDLEEDAVPTYVTVINTYTQYELGPNGDYEALTLAMRKIGYLAGIKSVGLPLIGCGIAGLNWTAVKAIIQNELRKKDVTIVHFKP